jgi:hypothetical protein
MPREYRSFLQDILDRSQWVITCTRAKAISDLRSD